MASVHEIGVGARGHVRVMVVGDNEVVQWGLRSLLGAQPWVERCLPARTADEAVAIAHRYEPQVALVDAVVGEDWGVAVCERLRALEPAPTVLLSTGSGSISKDAAQAAGAAGVVPRQWPVSDVALAVRMAANGVPLGATAADPVRLSPREREVLEQLATGATNGEIAGRLHLSPHTVKDHVSAVYRKLGVRNRAQAVQRGRHLGLTA
jgi:DNA-binding NarL/FixJ family response regulator